MSFNNFLSTSKTQDVSLGFATCALSKTDTVGILFQMSIDPSVSSAPFASIDEVSYFQTEEEILFSMHTVFRIGEIKQIDKNNPLYQVELTLTSDDDPQLRMLTEHIREEAGGGTGWQRIGTLLLKISQFDKAEELYTVLLEQTSDEGEKAHYYNHLGYVKNDQGDYEKAIWYYEKALEIRQKTLPPNHPDLATSYNNIGVCMTTWESTRKHFRFTKKHLKFDKKLFLQIILIWLLPTTTSVWCMTTWESTRKHFRFTKKHLKSIKKLFLQIILIWLLPTTTSVWCMTTWESTRKHFRFKNT